MPCQQPYPQLAVDMSPIFASDPGDLSGYGAVISSSSKGAAMADTCGHPGCKCEAREDGFCSDYCAEHAGQEGHEAHECGCGHTVCEHEAATS